MKLRVSGNAPVRQATAGSAGIDLTTLRRVVLWPFVPRKVRIELRCAIPEGHVGVIKDRSSMALAGVHALGGVIDSDYRGELAVILINLTPLPRWVGAGDRIAQMLVLPHASVELEHVSNLDETERGSGGFGSTGR